MDWMYSKDVRALIREGARQGIRLWVENGELHYKAPKGNMLAELRAALRSRRDELIGELSQPVFTKRGSVLDPVRYPEFWQDFWRETQANLSLSNTTHFALRLSGNISLERIHSALQWLARRYDVLRSRVRLVDGALCLVLENKDVPPLDVIDAQEARLPQLQTLVEQAVYTPFEDGQIYRARVIKVSANDYIVAVVIHHFVADAVSCKILTGQLIAKLRAEPSLGDSAELGSARERPLQYSDYLLGVNEWLSGAGLRYRLAYWQAQMREAPTVRFPLTHDPCSTATTRLDSLNIHINKALRAQVAHISSDARVPLAVVLLAAKFGALFHTLKTGDLVVHWTHSGRDDPKLLELVGMTVNCVPIRVSVLPEMSYAELLERVNDTYLLARGYQVPWGLLMRTLDDMGVRGIAPLFNYLPGKRIPKRNVTSTPRPAAELVFEHVIVKRPEDTNSVEWKSHEFTVVDSGEEMLANVKYMASRYQAAIIQQFARGFVFCLETIAKNPAQALGDVRRKAN